MNLVLHKKRFKPRTVKVNPKAKLWFPAVPNANISCLYASAHQKTVIVYHYFKKQQNKALQPVRQLNKRRVDTSTQHEDTSPLHNFVWCSFHLGVVCWRKKLVKELKKTGAGWCKAQAWCKDCPGSETEADGLRKKGHWWWWVRSSGLLIWILRTRSIRSRSSSSSRWWDRPAAPPVASSRALSGPLPSWDSYRRMFRVSS